MVQKCPKEPLLEISDFQGKYKGVKNPPFLYFIIIGVVEDTGGSWMEFYYQKSTWITKSYPYVPCVKISGVSNKYKCVKNPHVLYGFTAGVVEDTGGS